MMAEELLMGIATGVKDRGNKNKRNRGEREIENRRLKK
jgi:hypothetical protein